MLAEDKTMIISNMEYHHVVKEDDNAGDNYDDDNGDDDDDQDDACRRQRSARGGAAHSCGDHCGETLWVRTNKRKRGTISYSCNLAILLALCFRIFLVLYSLAFFILGVNMRKLCECQRGHRVPLQPAKGRAL